MGQKISSEGLADVWMASPVGRLRLVASSEGLVAVIWELDEQTGRLVIDGDIDDRAGVGDAVGAGASAPNASGTRPASELAADAAGKLDDASSADRILCSAVEQLTAYFAAELLEFDLPLDLRGTEFQTKAWRALASIPYGETISYQRQAERIGVPSAVRAIGAANGKNPCSIVLPCHRVVGADGSLTGFGGGLPTKRALLAFESRVAEGSRTPMDPVSSGQLF